MSAEPLTVAEAVARLDVYADRCRSCQDEIDATGIASGHVAAGHPEPRRTVHCQLGGLGADWDEAAVVEWLGTAERIVAVPDDHWLARTGHRVAGKGTWGPDDTNPPRWFAFSAVTA